MYSSPNIVRQIISRRTRWARNKACVGETTNTGFLLGNLKGRDTYAQNRGQN
jgi:hypothetical protein